MINDREFLIDEYNAGRFWCKRATSLDKIKDSSIKTYAKQYQQSRDILKKAGEPADKPLTASICRALAEGFLQPDFKIKDNGDRKQP